jgi:hypothetical protein
MSRNLILVAIVATASAGLVACGGSDSTTVVKSTPPQTVTEAAPSVTVTQPDKKKPKKSPAPAPAPPPPSKPTLPNLVGERLDVAERKLKQQGITFKEVGGGLFGIVVRSNWEVCETDPGAGTETDGPVDLIVDRPGDC